MEMPGHAVGSEGGLIGWLILQLSALGTLILTYIGFLPYAIGVSIPMLYYIIMIWEMRTVQHFVNNWRTRRIARRYAKAQAKAKVALARLEAIDLLRHARHEAREKVEQAAVEAAKLIVQKVADTKTTLPPV